MREGELPRADFQLILQPSPSVVRHRNQQYEQGPVGDLEDCEAKEGGVRELRPFTRPFSLSRPLDPTAHPTHT